MTNVGITAEYDPFHNGHLRQIEIVRKAGADSVIVVMSGNFLQRGWPAIMNEFSRAEIAVQCGADLVLELPFVFATSSACGFAAGAIKIMKATGIIDTVAFGSECGDIGILKKTAMDSLTADSYGFVKNRMQQGTSYPKAMSEALAAVKADFIPSKPNDLLALEYLRSILKYAPAMHSFTHQRIGDYHSSDECSDKIASATCIREKIENGEDFFQFVPEITQKVYQREVNNGKCLQKGSYDRFLLAQLRLMKNKDCFFTVGEDEGLKNRLISFANESTLQSLFEKAKTKRYPFSTICRTALRMAFGVSNENFEPICLRVLAFNPKGRQLLSEMRHKATLPIYHTLPAQMKNEPIIQFDSMASDLYGLFTEKPCSGGQAFKNVSYNNCWDD